LETGAGIDSSFLDTTNWASIIDGGFQSYQFSTLITEPTGVNDLLDELTEHNILIWWDERAQLVKMNTTLPGDSVALEVDDSDDIVSQSVSVARDDKNRVSQVWVIFGHRLPVLNRDKYETYTTVKRGANLELEGTNAYDQRRVKKIWSRWMPHTLAAVASEVSNRYLNYYKVTKKMLSVTLDAKDDNLWTGDIVTVSTKQLQGTNGGSPALQYRVLQVSEKGTKYVYTLQSTEQDDIKLANIGPNTLNDYSSESDANKEAYAFIASDDRGDGEPGFAPSDPPYNIL